MVSDNRNASGTHTSQGRSSLTGTVTEVLGGVYYVRMPDSTLTASLRGRLKQEARVGDRVVVGDRVQLALGAEDQYVIEEVLERETQIVRRTLNGRKAKVVAANLDYLVVVAAAKDPVPVPVLLDRLLLIGESGGLESHLVFTKMDLLSPGERGELDALAKIYQDVGYTVHFVSNVTGEGLEGCATLLCSGSSALIGPSGVGKSSILNAIQPGIELRTAEVGRRSKAGRHTTVSARLIDLDCGGVVADTPGFSDAGVWGVEPQNLADHFPDFRPYLDCRFRDCSHIHEPGCGVVEAVADGEVHERRYESYLALHEEVTSLGR